MPPPKATRRSRPSLEARIGRDEGGELATVRDTRTGQVVACSRLTGPLHLRRGGAYAAERHFELRALASLQSRLVELSALRVDPGYPRSVVFHLLGDRLARYLIYRRCDFMLFTVSVGIEDGSGAALQRWVESLPPCPIEIGARPRLRLPSAIQAAASIAPPPDLEAILDLGAWVCSDPAFDPECRCAIVPALLTLARLRVPEARRFLRRAA